jgi:hypothetical protein
MAKQVTILERVDVRKLLDEGGEVTSYTNVKVTLDMTFEVGLGRGDLQKLLAAESPDAYEGTIKEIVARGLEDRYEEILAEVEVDIKDVFVNNDDADLYPPEVDQDEDDLGED